MEPLGLVMGGLLGATTAGGRCVDASDPDPAQSGAMRTLLIDLNNFARFPTLAVGYLVASLRQAGIAVEVLSPLAHGMAPSEREGRETWRDQAKRRVHLADRPMLQALEHRVRDRYVDHRERAHPIVLQQTRSVLDDRRPDAILLSAYLDHLPSVEAIGRLALEHGVPLLLGGPAFNQAETARAWLSVPGLAAVVGAESDHSLAELVEATIRGRSLLHFPGVWLPDGRTGPPPAPLADLAELPIPDFSDFPWQRYPNRILPVMTGRGCEWGRCLFCSDVTSVNGRTYRSRPPAAVLDELETNGNRYSTSDCVFLDIKLNSNLRMWRSIITEYQHRLPGGSWIGTVHVGRGENGLTGDELATAAAAGMKRISFGLETGSQRLNDRMAKGTDIDSMATFISDAHVAGISVRTTMMTGYPGEDAKDIDATVAFLAMHEHQLDRVRLSKFKPIPGTAFQARFDADPRAFPGIRELRWNPQRGRASYVYAPGGDPNYRAAKRRLLRIVHRINRKPLRDGAHQFDGLM
jgi:anaerobic magnesium-protoporphyrin IX monomethyl ester cyclase